MRQAYIRRATRADNIGLRPADLPELCESSMTSGMRGNLAAPEPTALHAGLWRVSTSTRSSISRHHGVEARIAGVLGQPVGRHLEPRQGRRVERCRRAAPILRSSRTSSALRPLADRAASCVRSGSSMPCRAIRASTLATVRRRVAGRRAARRSAVARAEKPPDARRAPSACAAGAAAFGAVDAHAIRSRPIGCRPPTSGSLRLYG